MFTTRNSFMAASGTLVGMAITAALLAAPLAPGYVAEDEADARQPIIVTSPQTLDLRDVMALDDLPFVQNSLGPHGVMLGEHPGHLLMMHPAQFDRNRMFRGGLFFGADHPGVYAFAHPIGDTTMQSFSESHTIEVTIKDGKTTIRLDGEEVPEDRLKRIGDHIIILDENGEEVRTITIGGGEEMLREFAPGFRIGDDAGVWRLKRDGARHPKVMLGVNLDEPDEALRYHLGLETGVTTLVPSLYKGLPAYEAGLRPYDIIVAIDGEGPADPTSLRAALADKESGDAIGLTVIQAGQRKDLTVELTAYDTELMVRGDLVGEAAPHLDVTAKFPTWFTPNGATRFNQPNLRDFFIDEDNRVFEVPRFFGESKVWEESGAKDNEQQLNSRLEKVNERLAELEKMLDELLEEAGASER